MRSTGPFSSCRVAALSAVFVALGHSGSALELDFPATAELVFNTQTNDTAHPIASGPFAGGLVPTDFADGIVQQFIWHVSGDDVTALGLLGGLRDQLLRQGFTLDFTCSDQACGGFDFRHALPVGNPPEMHVDLGNFHYIAASLDDQRAALMVSQGGATGFVHLALVQGDDAPTDAPIALSTRSPDLDDDTLLILNTEVPDGLIGRLIDLGAAPLDDLRFETGASSLSGDTYGSLNELATYLNADRDRRVVLVGHTDAMGSLDGNIALSQARANAVRSFLTGELGVNPAQVRATGIGFLAPRATNTTAEGRETNRRVEVVLENPG